MDKKLSMEPEDIEKLTGYWFPYTVYFDTCTHKHHTEDTDLLNDIE